MKAKLLATASVAAILVGCAQAPAIITSDEACYPRSYLTTAELIGSGTSGEAGSVVTARDHRH